MFFTTSSTTRNLVSFAAHAICGVMISLLLSWILRSGFSGSIGSLQRTSRPAPAMEPSVRAVYKSGSFTMAASRKIQENSGFLHLAEFFQCHQILRVPVQRCMDGKNIRAGKKLIQAYLFIFCIVFLPGSGIADNMAAKCLGNLRHPVSNCAKTDNSQVFPSSSKKFCPKWEKQVPLAYSPDFT